MVTTFRLYPRDSQPGTAPQTPGCLGRTTCQISRSADSVPVGCSEVRMFPIILCNTCPTRAPRHVSQAYPCGVLPKRVARLTGYVAHHALLPGHPYPSAKNASFASVSPPLRNSTTGRSESTAYLSVWAMHTTATSISRIPCHPGPDAVCGSIPNDPLRNTEATRCCKHRSSDSALDFPKFTCFCRLRLDNRAFQPHRST